MEEYNIFEISSKEAPLKKEEITTIVHKAYNINNSPICDIYCPSSYNSCIVCIECLGWSFIYGRE